MHRSSSRVPALALASFGLLAGCGDSPPAATMAEDGGTDAQAPAVASPDVCDRILAGPVSESDRSARAQWADAHATVRSFGHVEQPGAVDVALRDAIGSESTWEVGDALAAYSASVVDVCSLEPTQKRLGQVRTRRDNSTLWITPGRGEVDVPNGVDTIVLDLRGLPETADTRAAIERVLATALAQPMERSPYQVRVHTGYQADLSADDFDTPEQAEMFAQYKIYFNEPQNVTPDALAAGANRRELVVVTGHELAPSAAEVAAELRMSRRAWLVGHDLLSAVAESRLLPVGDAFLSVRTKDYLAWPDVIPADIATDDPEGALAGLNAQEQPPQVEGASTRSRLQAHDRNNDLHSDARSLAQVRASVMTLFGMLNRFYPYMESVAGPFEARFEEVMDAVNARADEAPLELTHWALSRMGNALNDSLFQVEADDIPASAVSFCVRGLDDCDELRMVPIAFELLDDGSLVVGASRTDSIQVGDRVLSIGGVTMEAFWDREAGLLPLGQTPHDDLTTVATKFLEVDAEEVEVQYQRPEGDPQTVSVATVPHAEWLEINAIKWAGPSRWLSEEGAPDIFYLNLTGASRSVFEPDEDHYAQFLDLFPNKGSALVLDARGSDVPDNLYSILAFLTDKELSSSQWIVPTWTGPESRSTEAQPWPLQPDGSFFGRPVVMLTSPSNGGYNETAIALAGEAELVTLVGRNTLGSNGNITWLDVPGGFTVAFRGMETRNADGSEFHGVGIQPDIEVSHTLTDLLAGRDPDLAAAVEFLKAETAP